MAVIFGPRANLVTNATLLALAALALFAAFLIWGVPLMHYTTQVTLTPSQPVPFSHQHHVSGLGIDCRYCHTSVETSGFAGIPPTKTCMNCHSQIWTNAPLLEPVRASFKNDKSLVWTRVHDLPDFVYFSHEIHINKGVGCKSCHGPIDELPLTYQNVSLQMEWCLSCHRDTAKELRPREEVFNMTYQPPSRQNAVAFNGVKFFDQRELGKAIQKAYHIKGEQEMISC